MTHTQTTYSLPSEVVSAIALLAEHAASTPSSVLQELLQTTALPGFMKAHQSNLSSTLEQIRLARSGVVDVQDLEGVPGLQGPANTPIRAARQGPKDHAAALAKLDGPTGAPAPMGPADTSLSPPIRRWRWIFLDGTPLLVIEQLSELVYAVDTTELVRHFVSQFAGLPKPCNVVFYSQTDYAQAREVIPALFEGDIVYEGERPVFAAKAVDPGDWPQWLIGRWYYDVEKCVTHVELHGNHFPSDLARELEGRCKQLLRRPELAQHVRGMYRDTVGSSVKDMEVLIAQSRPCIIGEYRQRARTKEVELIFHSSH